MNGRRLATLALAVGIVAGQAAGAVEEKLVTWHDAARDRDVPAKIYAPADAPGPLPLIVFSPGLGGTREGYAYLGRHWAGQGYLCVVVQHPGSDAKIFTRDQPLKESAKRAAADPANWRDRPLDVSFGISQMLRDPRVNTNAIGVAGHSFGANTTLVLIGQRVAGQSYRDPRVKAAIAMSAPRPWTAEALREIHDPCLHLTGTRDESPVFPTTTAADRRYPFDHIAAPGQYLVTLKEAEHFAFSDNPAWAGKRLERNPRHHEIICRVTTAFWDAYLKQDARAKAWLADGGMTKELEADATVETK